MTDTEKTEPGVNKWAEAERAVDDTLAAAIRMPHTWVLLAIWSGLCVLAGAVVF